MVRQPVQRTDAGSGFFEGGEVAGCARQVARTKLSTPSPIVANDALTLGSCGEACEVPMMPSTVGCRAMALAKISSSGFRLGKLAQQGSEFGRVAQRLGQLIERSAAGIGEHHVEHHDTHARGNQLVDQSGEKIAPPGPIAERLYRAFVDVDDANRIIRVGRARQRLLEQVETEQAQASHEARIGLPDHDAHRNDAENDQPIGSSDIKPASRRLAPRAAC